MIVVTAPDLPRVPGFFEDVTSVFLAGSIELGVAREWQDELVSQFEGYEGLTFFNPRRNVWDPTWSQDPSNTKLTEQIRWELARIEEADCVFFYIQAGTMSPITLLELGLVLGSGTTPIVVCEPGFWREANVVETCAFKGVTVMTSLEAGIKALKDGLDRGDYLF